MSQETLSLLKKTKAVIEDENHWCRGIVEDTGGRHCIMGAMNVADHGNSDYWRDEDATGDEWLIRYKDALHLLASLLPEDKRKSAINDGWALATFNNTHSHAEVIRLLDEAIAKAA